MNIASGYTVANNNQWGYYVAEKTSQSSEFTIPTPELADEKQTTTDKAEDSDPFKSDKAKLPEWMWTKTTATRSDDEILKDIMELAQESARTGQPRGERFDDLMKEYISSVSPDRAGIFEKSASDIKGAMNSQDNSYTMSEIFRQINEQRDSEKEEEKKDEKELIDYLIEAFNNKGNGKIGDGEYSIIKGDMYEALLKNGEVEQAEFFDPEFNPESGNGITGKSVMKFESGKFALGFTEPELLRKAEFVAAYDAAHDFASGNYTGKTQPMDYNDLEKKLNSARNDMYSRVYNELKNNSAVA